MYRFSVTLAYAADTGRVNYDSMNEQTLMELVVTGMKGASRLKKYGLFMDSSRWPGLKTNSEGCISEIDFSVHYVGDLFADDDTFAVVEVLPPDGRIDIQWLPRTIQKFSIREMYLVGRADTSNLPRGMQSFNIEDNLFTGTFCMETLPEGIENIEIGSNQLEGHLNISTYLPCLQSFCAAQNMFSGSLDFSALPGLLGQLVLSNNRFSGSIDLSHLPDGLRYFEISKNDLSQDVLVIGFPSNGGQFIFYFDRDKFGETIGTDGEGLNYNGSQFI